MKLPNWLLGSWHLSGGIVEDHGFLSQTRGASGGVERCMRVRVAVALVLLTALALATAGGVAVYDRWQERELPVVRTVDDLLGRRPIVLPGGVKVWAGVSGKEVRPNGAVLFCAITEGFDSNGRAVLSGTEALGPLRVREVRGEKRLAELLKRGPRRFERALFVHSVFLDEPGSHELTLETREKATVGRVTITVAGDPEPTFLRVESVSRCLDDGHLDPVGCVAIAARCARPRIAGEIAREVPAAFLPAPFETPTLGLALEGDLLTVTSAFEDLESGPIPERFAARVWVNERSFVTSRFEEEEPRSELARRSWLVGSQRLHLHLDREVLGARKGDRVSVQLLVLSGRWPRLTNRIEVP